MKFGLFYEHQLPRPWKEGAELALYDETLEQVELADRLGIDYAWAVEHHFLDEHSHLSAPEVFLAACAQRTRSIRLGHSVMVMTPPYNHPARGGADRDARPDQQKPHPPLWLGCSRRETIHRAARHGLGVLAFGFAEPEQAAHWVREYYDIIRSDECVPIGRTVNANIAVVSAFSLHEDEDEAVGRALDGFRFFGYSLGWNSVFGRHVPGRSDLWASFSAVRDTLPNRARRGAVGASEQVRDHLERYERVGVDQVIFAQQCGRNRHEDICASLRLFAETLLPEFKRRDVVRQREKAAELAPHIARAEARRAVTPPMAGTDIPVVEAFGLRTGRSPSETRRSPDISDRGAGIPVPDMDPHTP